MRALPVRIERNEAKRSDKVVSGSEELDELLFPTICHGDAEGGDGVG